MLESLRAVPLWAWWLIVNAIAGCYAVILQVDALAFPRKPRHGRIIRLGVLLLCAVLGVFLLACLGLITWIESRAWTRAFREETRG